MGVFQSENLHVHYDHDAGIAYVGGPPVWRKKELPPQAKAAGRVSKTKGTAGAQYFLLKRETSTARKRTPKQELTKQLRSVQERPWGESASKKSWSRPCGKGGTTVSPAALVGRSTLNFGCLMTCVTPEEGAREKQLRVSSNMSRGSDWDKRCRGRPSGGVTSLGKFVGFSEEELSAPRHDGLGDRGQPIPPNVTDRVVKHY